MIVLREINYCHVPPSRCARSVEDEAALSGFTPSAGLFLLLPSGPYGEWTLLMDPSAVAGLCRDSLQLCAGTTGCWAGANSVFQVLLKAEG